MKRRIRREEQLNAESHRTDIGNSESTTQDLAERTFLASQQPKKQWLSCSPPLVFLALVVAALLAAHYQVAHAAVPQDLTNFQNEFACNLSVRIVRPRTVQDVQEAVRLHVHVQANGEGHSWNQPFFCANPNVTTTTLPEEKQPLVEVASNGGLEVTGTDDMSETTSANIVMATIRPLEIEVLEDEEAVWVDGGIMTIAFIEYLANYITEKAPSGWTIGAFPWFVYQSLSGAIATGSHGSSLTYNSMSHQVLALEVVKADGSLDVLTPETHPLLMRAARVSVGQLGIITRIKFRIVREVPVKRELRALPTTAYLGLLKEAQESYLETGGPPDWLDETEFFWITQRSEFLMVSFTRGDSPNPAARSEVLKGYHPQETTIYNTKLEVLQDPNVNSLENLPLREGAEFGPSGLTPESKEITDDILLNNMNAEPLFNASAAQRVRSSPSTGGTFAGTVPQEVSQLDQEPAVNENATLVDFRDRVEGSKWEMPEPRKPMTFYATPSSAAAYIDISRVGVATIAKNATVEASDAYLAQPSQMRDSIRSVPYDQYEVAIPVTSMHECMSGLMDMVYKGDLDSLNSMQRSADKGFRTAPLIRFVGQEEGLIAYTYDGPKIFLNIEDYLYYNQGRKRNERFHEVMGYLRSNPHCGSGGPNGTGGARLHFGKAGWPEKGCWRGDLEFPEKAEGGWCSFACAIRQADPQNKFRDSGDDRWNFDGLNLESCCGPEGFLRQKPGCECKVIPKRDPATCPPSPYYTDR